MISWFRSSVTIVGLLLWAMPAIAFPSNMPSVTQLSDVSVNDWAFQALRSLTERYGCITGYSDATFRGTRSLSRYEFAAALANCLDRINPQIADSALNPVSPNDLATLNRLQADFATELTGLSGRVDVLEARTSNLEAQSFSTTTKLNGEVIFALAGVGGNRRTDDDDELIDSNVILGSRVRLELNTSFSGQDRLRVRLQFRNIPEFEDATGTPMSNLGFDGVSENGIELDRLDYETRIGDRASVIISAVGGGLGDYVSAVNSNFSGSEDGAVSLFGRENPIRRQGSVPGIGLTYELTDSLQLELGYVAREADDPEIGIAKSAYAAIAQLTARPSRSTRFSMTYLRSFNGIDTGTGSVLAGDPFDDDSEAIVANSFGAEFAIDLTRKITLGGRVGWIQATAQDLDDNSEANLFTWAAMLSVEDLGGDGNLLGFLVGQPLRVTRNQYDNRDPDPALHLEVFYLLRANDNIEVTPGAYIIFNPDHNASNDPVYVGVVRTTFSF